jgi:heat shock protein HslJ
MGALSGTTWVLARSRSGAALVEVPDDVRADARFAEGRVSGSTGCNSFTAPYEAASDGPPPADGPLPAAGPPGAADRGSLRIGPCATTMMACPPPQVDVERGFLAALAATAAYVVDVPRLALLDETGAVVAELVASPADAYVGAWEATGVNNGRQAVTGLVAGSSIVLDLEADGRVTGTATCNRYVGAYAVDGEGIRFGPLATTRMACPDEELAEQERAYLAGLAAAASWSVRGDRLELRDADGALQATFRRR